jgi:hypothetical protein
MDLLRFIVTRHFDDLIKAGATKELAIDLSKALEQDICRNYGGTKSYVRSIRFTERDRVVRNAWASAVHRNDNLPPESRMTAAQLRDQVCNDHGISRYTLSRLLSNT